MQVINATTAAQIFHAFRRQLLRPFRKPLIVIAPKKMLKLREAASDLDDFALGTSFQRIIKDTSVDEKKVKKVIFCSGQVYYDLVTERTKYNRDDVAILRMEQLAPFPYSSLRHELAKYPNAKIEWVQEEQKNQGAWSFVEPRIRNTLKFINHSEREVKYVGRPISASTATGYGANHRAELDAFLKEAMQ